jgi:uncharacterized protein (DUF58 family)
VSGLRWDGLRLDPLGYAMLGAAALAVAGWWLGSSLVAAAGAVGLAGGGLVFGWQRWCLVGVGYTRHLERHRAVFGEDIGLRVEIVNDKLLPLTWLHVADDLSSPLTIEGGTVTAYRGSESFPRLTQLLPMLPYQHVERHLTVHCDRRGLHRIGPARLRSGDPIGYRDRSVRLTEVDELLVYPKIFALEPFGVVSRVPLGAARAARLLMEDPSRMIGSREYQVGDPLRQIDWRATARHGSPLVRVFQPSASPRVAVFLDTRVPQLFRPSTDPPELEFTIAVAASVVAELTARKLGVGLFSTGTVGGMAIAHQPTTSPDTLAQILDLLARASPFGSLSLAGVLAIEGARLPHGTSVMVVAADFPEDTLMALGEMRRRHLPVTAVAVATDRGGPPPGDLFDDLLTAEYTSDWQTKPALQLVA